MTNDFDPITVTPIDETEAVTAAPGRTPRRWLIAGGVAATAVVVGAVAVPVALARSDEGRAASTPMVQAATAVVASVPGTSADGGATAVDRASPEVMSRDVELGDVTLGDLAEELAELGLELKITPEGGSDVDAGGDHDHDHEIPEDEQPLGAFPVDGDRLDVTGASSGEVARQASEIWDRFVEIIPADQRRMVSSFELVPEEFGGAYVYQDPADPRRWVLGVGLGLGGELDAVLIHEFAHLLTLQASELPPETAGDPSCPTFDPGEGCALSDSTMAEFVARFWPQERLDEIAAIEESEDYDRWMEFYEEHQDEFVTDYAASNAVEDLAETFMVFVLEDRPTGDTIADDKVRFLWDDPELVALREEIRSRL
ncbi:MAG: hypothetical protein AAGA99_25835 [Actinomycetota bacterium]